MLTFNIKTIRQKYNALSALVEKLNFNTLEKDLTKMARQITEDDIFQTFSEIHGRMINVTTKNVDDLIFVIILDDIKNELELSPTIAIKDTNGKVLLTWNIKDEFITINT